MNTTIRKYSLFAKANEREQYALSVVVAADAAYRAEQTPENLKRLELAVDAHKRAKADTRDAQLDLKYSRGTVMA